MPKYVFNPFTGDFDVVAQVLSELDDVDDAVSPTKGSILAADGTEYEEFAVGANGLVLTADSTQATGIRWATAPGGGGGITLTAGENLSLGDLLSVDSSGEVVLADATFSSNVWELVYVALAAAASAASVDVASSGDLVPVRFSSAPAGATNGDPVFLSATPGEATLTPPSTSGNIVFIVGVMQGADGVTTTPDVAFQPQFISRIT